MSRYNFNISSHHRYLYINNLCVNKMLLKSQVMMELNVKRVTWYMSHLISFRRHGSATKQWCDYFDLLDTI